MVKPMEGLDEIKNLMKSLSISDTEKKDQLNIFMLHSHIKWLEDHIKWLERRIDKLEGKIDRRKSPKLSEDDQSFQIEDYASAINTTKRARIFDFLLKNTKVEGKEIAKDISSDPNYVSYLMNWWVKKGLINSPYRGVFKLSVDEKMRKYIQTLVNDVLK